MTFSPTGASDEITDGFTNVRAHLLSSFNLADFVVSVPSIGVREVRADGGDDEDPGRAPSARRGGQEDVAEDRPGGAGPGHHLPGHPDGRHHLLARPRPSSTGTSGVNLDITPKVNPSGDISLELTAEFSLLGKGATLAGQDLPTFLTRNVVGVLRLRDGETSLIGGLVQRSETDSLQRGPGAAEHSGAEQDLHLAQQEATRTTRSSSRSRPTSSARPKVIEDDLAGLVVGTEEIPKVEGARPPLFGPPSEAPPPGAVSGAAPRPVPVPSTVPPRAPAPVGPSNAAPVVEAPLSRPGEPAAGAARSNRPSLVRPRRRARPRARPSSGSDDSRRVTVQLSSPETVKQGEIATLSLVIVGLRDLTSLETVVNLDAGLEAVEAKPGPLLTLDGATVGAERGHRSRPGAGEAHEAHGGLRFGGRTHRAGAWPASRCVRRCLSNPCP